MIKKVFIASDHAGYELKNKLFNSLSTNNSYVTKNIEFIDLGCPSSDSVDYPDYADVVCKELNNPDHIGLLICGSGQGMCMRANKFPHVRAALVYNDEIAKLSREHNDANVVCLGARFTSLEETLHWVDIFLNTKFAGGRHQQRVEKIKKST